MKFVSKMSSFAGFARAPPDFPGRCSGLAAYDPAGRICAERLGSNSRPRLNGCYGYRFGQIAMLLHSHHRCSDPSSACRTAADTRYRHLSNELARQQPARCQRRIAGGRARLRRSLFAAALPAAFRWNKALIALYTRLTAAGKAHNAALIACARKLLIYANNSVLPTIVVEGRKACEGCGFLAADPAEFGHADRGAANPRGGRRRIHRREWRRRRCQAAQPPPRSRG
jgi:hypothetical protein